MNANKVHIQPQNNPAAFLTHLKERGLIHDQTPQLESYLKDCAEKNICPKIYLGCDPSSISLQVGNLLAVLLLRRAQLFGIQPIILLGGATGLIGDPSGKKEERTLLDKNEAEKNLQNIKAQVMSFVHTKNAEFNNPAIVVNNFDWFEKFSYLDFLRDVGKHITINYMTAKDSVKIRMETGISYAEFGYMLIQGYDFLHLFETNDCRIQIGGSDQWGNMTTGLELIRRKHGAEAHAISAPLLTDSAGNKFGKSEKNAIYLDAKLTTPFQFYQFWLGQADSEMPKLLKQLTLFSDAKIQSILDEGLARPELRSQQKALALEMTCMVHGEEAAKNAEAATQVLFSKDPAALDRVNTSVLALLEREVPSTKLSHLPHSLLDLLVNSGLCKSKGEARRLQQSGGISINRAKVGADLAEVTEAHFAGRSFFLLGVGKSQLHLVQR